jgi:hypothetical protein
MSRRVYKLHSALSPDALLEALRRTTDPDRRSYFSLSGYRGDRPLIRSEASVGSFRLQKRRYWRNDFAPFFYAQFKREPGGTLIEGFLNMAKWARYFMRIWLALAILIGAPIFIRSFAEMASHRGMVNGDLWVGVLVPPSMVLWGFVLPQIGRLLSRGEQGFILDYLETTLAARLEETGAIPAMAGRG